MTLGERLEELRLEKKLTIKEAGEIFHLSKSTISAYENNTRRPNLEILLEFSEFYNVTVDYLLGKSDDRSIYLTIDDIPEELRKVGVEYISLAKEMEDKEIPPEDIRKIIEVIRDIKK